MSQTLLFQIGGCESFLVDHGWLDAEVLAIEESLKGHLAEIVRDLRIFPRETLKSTIAAVGMRVLLQVLPVPHLNFSALGMRHLQLY